MDRICEREYEGMRKTKVSDQMRSSPGIVEMATEATGSPRSTPRPSCRKHHRLSASSLSAAMFDGCFAEGHALNST
jgi:hypothetical protein